MASILRGAEFTHGTWRDLVPLRHRVHEISSSSRKLLTDTREPNLGTLLGLTLGKLPSYSIGYVEMLINGGEILYSLTCSRLMVLRLWARLEK